MNIQLTQEKHKNSWDSALSVGLGLMFDLVAPATKSES